MRYFVTGGAGFIGSHYVRHLLKDVQDCSKVTVYDAFTYAGNIKNIQDVMTDSRLQIIKGDICDFQKLLKEMKNYDSVINFAAETHVDRSIHDASTFVNSNVLGASNILEVSLRNEIPMVVQISTDEVYGSLSAGSSSEDSNLNPSSPYSSSKAAADLIAKSYFTTHNLDVRITRSCNNYGPSQYPEKLIPFFVKQLMEGKKVPLYGNGKNIREWICVTDSVRAIQLVVTKGKAGEIYNIGSEFSISNLELTQLILQYFHLSEVFIQFVNDRKGHDFRYSLSSEKIKKMGFKPHVNFTEGLFSTISWIENNSNWWRS